MTVGYAIRPSLAIGSGIDSASCSTSLASAAGSLAATCSRSSLGFVLIGSDTEVTPGSFSMAATASVIDVAALPSVRLCPFGTANTTVAVAPFCEEKRWSSRS